MSSRLRRALVAAPLVLAACASPARRRGATVMFASGADLQSINPLLTVHPLARQVQRYVLFTTLARYDSLLQPRPYLARRWEWSPDRTRLTFRLVTDLRWHDGVPTTAADVVWTLDAGRNPATGYPRQSDLAEMAAVTAPDDSTVTIRFTVPQSRFPDVLTDLAILPSHLLDTVPAAALRRAAFNQAPVGNGPFRFVAHEPDRRWVFERNPGFPADLGGPPRLDRFIVVVVDEPTTKLAALTSGELDFAGIQPAHAAFARRDPRLAVVTYPLFLTYGLVLNLRHPPFDDLAVRRAVSLGVDRREIVSGYLFGFGAPAGEIVPPGVPDRLGLPAPRYDPDSARRLLGGRPISFELLTVGSGEGALEQLLQARLGRAGFTVTIRQLELSAFLDRMAPDRHQFDAAVMGIPGDPGLGYLTPLGTLAGLDPPRDRAAAERLLADSMAVVPLYFAEGLQGMNRRVRGVRMDVRGELCTVHDWWVR